MDGSKFPDKPLILLVDDEPNNLRILSDTLRFDFELAVATSGARALQFVESDSIPDLILLDVMMPGMDGYEVCGTLKKNPQFRHIPIIFVTAATDSESEEKGFRLGAVDYIHKPFNRSVVMARIRSHLSVHGMMDRLSHTASKLDASIATEVQTGRDGADGPIFSPQGMLLDAVFSQSMEGITVTDAAGIIKAVNPAFTRITGYRAEEVVNRNQAELRNTLKRAELSTEIWKRIQKTGYWQGELINQRKGGETYPELRTIRAVSDSEGRISHYVSVFSDISTNKQNQSTIDFLTWYDSLTSLPNRMLFLQRLEATVQLCAEGEAVAAAIIVDIDRFKAINESLGLEAGDQVLTEVSNRLANGMSNNETIARIAGDKFAILLAPRRCDDQLKANRALALSTRIQEQLCEPMVIADQILNLSVTQGVTLIPGTLPESAKDVLRNAEMAHAKAKREKMGDIVFFNERMGHEAMEQFRLSQALHNAIPRQELTVYLQSQHDINGQVVGAEALLRWQHPELGMVSPAAFIPLAESEGNISELDRWVLDQVLMIIRNHQKQLGSLRLAINISPSHFARDDFISHIISSLRKHRIGGHHLTLELTESLMIQELTAVVSKLHALAGLGIEVSIDDFGTGYSSLSYLQQLPIQELKIDRSFTQTINGDRSGRSIVSMIHNMAAELGLRTVVEGVETSTQLQYLQHFPNTVIQGYYFSKPIPAEQWLDECFTPRSNQAPGLQA
ncbi:two-component system response regulator [Marinobacter mobilis]|uniref:PAS domain S-box-containing protein/diguanylate cyclase (GGDEF) domain-containing protein n=1 Tax=Marinobacter mobilis TaxID=488533 RepID=A0A1H2WH11_9GAMM|nr:EAL domain-containing protein [Marinobacter mobilis]SDW79811.1 PAS domain S-box-containing protein/diguanylate cyclase (GGDEF) domain-containing protein [Marinobacter mobilis]